MERSFKKEVEKLKLGSGQMFRGEGILAVTKALLQSGVSYVGGYQGAPVSHMMDVLNDAQEILDDLGVHVEVNANEAGAAAMLSASMHYPVRGAVTWKSTVGTNVASDALSHLASAGVVGGALVVIGEDYGEGASIIQERSHAFAMKSQMWLLDPRPDLRTITRMVEHGFGLSEATSTPVMLELRIRACHVHGEFETKDNVRPAISRRDGLNTPRFDFNKICMPPGNYVQEKQKVEVRWPAAIEYIADNRLNEQYSGDIDDLGIVLEGGMYNVVIRSLQQMGLADAFGNARIPLYVLNVTYPLVPREVQEFCAGKAAVLMVEEGQPAYLEDALHATLRKADIATKVYGKDVLPLAGEYVTEVVVAGLARFLVANSRSELDAGYGKWAHELAGMRAKATEILGAVVPPRPPGFCVGCPERPVFSAIKLVQREVGQLHVSADVGCHTFGALPPFNIGNTVLGYGLGLASNSAVQPLFAKRTLTIMGDGGYWHNGLTTGAANAVFNKDDGILLIMKNGYSSATGTQNIPSSPHQAAGMETDMTIEATLKALGVKWMKRVHNYRVTSMRKVLKEAITGPYQGLKVIIAEGECQLERQRRLRPLRARMLKEGKRVVRERFGIDDDVCTGDHSCIRLSGCPSLTIKPNPDPLRLDPVASVNSGCVGCGLCGEVAHAAILCPSFYRAEIIQNPSWWDRTVHAVRSRVISFLQPAEPALA